MVWDILIATATLSIGALLEIAIANLLWVFMFFSLGYIFFDGKKPVRAFIHVTLAALFFAQLLPFLGWEEYTGPFLGLYYLVDFSVLKFAETSKFWVNKLVWVEELTFFSSVILFNLIA
tara:strand:- start:23919 stop:24275 length:357 start_codon:yes stop_codon:yes gene_type:complete